MDRFVAGQWNAICDRCGSKVKSGDIQREWNGLRVCGSCWEPRHPQDFVTAKADRQVPPWTRPEADDVFVSTPVTPEDL